MRGTIAFACALVLFACRRPSASALPDGTYRCQTLAAESRYEASVLGELRVSGSSYVDARGAGTIAIEGAIASFAGGPLDGSRAAIGSTDAGVYLRFRASSMGAPGDQTRTGDQLCFLAR